jgi:hypothetical protein
MGARKRQFSHLVLPVMEGGKRTVEVFPVMYAGKKKRKRKGGGGGMWKV